MRPAVSEWLDENFELAGPSFGIGPEEVTDYVDLVKGLGLQRQRNFKAQVYKAHADAKRIDELALEAAGGDKDRAKEMQTDWIVVLENGAKNHLTGKTIAQIKREMTPQGRKAIVLGRGYFEKMRQSVDQYLRGAKIAEWVKFIEDYFIHSYRTPLTEKYKSAIGVWAKRTGQTKKRSLPNLAEAAEMGLLSRADSLADGLRLWAGINFRVETNLAFLQVLPTIVNESGAPVVQKPTDAPDWPTLDHYAIRQTYARRIGKRGVLLWQGRVAVDPKVHKHLNAMFDRPFSGKVARAVGAVNSMFKAVELTLFSLFHHQALLTSSFGGVGPFRTLFGLWGKEAEVFGATKALWGLLPYPHISAFAAGK